ncbi:PDZ domain-containing protein [Demequina sp. NBRC 110051]|uniref:YlbL family protein n=1 Tax=Demequina sp. NBRC 110051 TaxID=1570340 RepID=UPI0009FFCE5D|nr:S16 family serine protease [Demequina sp. NBRC 110051]
MTTDPDPLAPAEPDPFTPIETEPGPGARRDFTLALTGLGAALLLAVLSILPARFAIGMPGPTFDTLGTDEDGAALVEISGAPTYDASGELRLTTVSVARGSSTWFSLGQVLRGWVADDRYVQPEEAVLGDPEDSEQVEQESQQQWVTSQESATVAALTALGQEVPATIEVAALTDTTNADGLLEPGDVITAVDGEPIDSYTDLFDYLERVTPGDDVMVTVDREGTSTDATFATLDDGAGNAVMGIYVEPHFEMPIDVTVQIDKVGGPSAGLMFSLAIMDKLTEKDELGGALVAGTGAISADGDVEPIGGIRMKMHGARDAGADWFLAPVENCDEVVGNIPDGLNVFAVDDLDDGYAAIEAIGAGDTSGLATCTAA